MFRSNLLPTFPSKKRTPLAHLQHTLLLSCTRFLLSSPSVFFFIIYFRLFGFFFFLLWRCDPTQVMASSFLRFLDHTQRRTTVGRTPLDEWPARRRDLYLTTHNTHNRQISMPPVGFETTISAGERQQTVGYVLEYWKSRFCFQFYFRYICWNCYVKRRGLESVTSTATLL